MNENWLKTDEEQFDAHYGSALRFSSVESNMASQHCKEDKFLLAKWLQLALRHLLRRRIPCSLYSTGEFNFLSPSSNCRNMFDVFYYEVMK